RVAGLQLGLLLPPSRGGEGDQEGSEAPEEGHARGPARGSHLGGLKAGAEGGPVPADRGGQDLRLRGVETVKAEPPPALSAGSQMAPGGRGAARDPSTIEDVGRGVRDLGLGANAPDAT